MCEGVNTGVRSSRAVNAYSSASDELKSALDACGQQARVGSVEGSSDPGTYFRDPGTPEQTEANRLFQRCMVAQGWWPLQPPL